MAVQRLDLRSVRYDRLSGSVLFDARNCVVEVSLEALEALYKALSDDQKKKADSLRTRSVSLTAPAGIA